MEYDHPPHSQGLSIQKLAKSVTIYATRCLNRGIRLEVVAKLLGHSTTRITQHYAKLLKNNILNEVKDAFEKSH